jgi:hypothetical protein
VPRAGDGAADAEQREYEQDDPDPGRDEAERRDEEAKYEPDDDECEGDGEHAALVPGRGGVETLVAG